MAVLARFLLVCLCLSRLSAIEWDSNGYVLYCPCMGRFGNQVAHFLGALQFAKDLNRTLTLPPFRTYRNVPFQDWFKPEVVSLYHISLPLELFLDTFGDTHWPPGDRAGYCYRSRDPEGAGCLMKEGNPFGPFWDELGVDFTTSVFTQLSYDTQHTSLLKQWTDRFPPSSHPILAFKGAPASFPVSKRNRHLQQYLIWSDSLMTEAVQYINNTMNNQRFIAVHLRIGSDWDKACVHAVGSRSYMESLMCLESLPEDRVITQDMCYPTVDSIVADIASVLSDTGISVVYIGSDVTPPLGVIRERLGNTVTVYHMNPHGPQLDLIMFELSDHFISNCVSSLSAIVTRARDIKHLPTSHWGLVRTDTYQHEEL